MTFITRATKAVAAASLCLALTASGAFANTLQDIIESAEATFGGTAYEAGQIGNFTEVQVLSGSQLIEALYDGDSGALLDSDAFGSPRLVQRVANAVDVAVISLSDAIAAAEAAVGPGEVLEALLVTSRRSAGRRYFVDIRTDEGIFDVIVDSANGNILRIIRD